VLRSLTRTAGWEEFTERHLSELRARGVDVQAIQERLSAEGALRIDKNSGRVFVLAERLDAHARALLGIPAVFDGKVRTKRIVEVLSGPREKSLDQLVAEAFSGSTGHEHLARTTAERLQRNAEQQRQVARSIRALGFAEALARDPDAATEIRQALDGFLGHFTASEQAAIEKFPELVRANASAFVEYFAAWRRGERNMVPAKQVPSSREVLEVTLLGRR
jgi:hypothetical protein